MRLQRLKHLLLQSKRENEAMLDIDSSMKVSLRTLEELGVSDRCVQQLRILMEKCKYDEVTFFLSRFALLKYNDEEFLHMLLIDAYKTLRRYHEVKYQRVVSRYMIGGVMHQVSSTWKHLSPHLIAIRTVSEWQQIAESNLRRTVRLKAEIQNWRDHPNWKELRETKTRELAEKAVSLLPKLSKECASSFVESFASVLELKVIKKGELIYEEKTYSDSVYFTGIGTVCFYRSSSDEFPFDLMDSQHSFFCAWPLTGEKTMFGARAATLCFLFEMKVSHLYATFVKYPEFEELIIKSGEWEKEGLQRSLKLQGLSKL